MDSRISLKLQSKSPLRTENQKELSTQQRPEREAPNNLAANKRAQNIRNNTKKVEPVGIKKGKADAIVTPRGKGDPFVTPKSKQEIKIANDQSASMNSTEQSKIREIADKYEKQLAEVTNKKSLLERQNKELNTQIRFLKEEIDSLGRYTSSSTTNLGNDRRNPFTEMRVDFIHI